MNKNIYEIQFKFEGVNCMAYVKSMTVNDAIGELKKQYVDMVIKDVRDTHYNSNTPKEFETLVAYKG